MSSRLPGADRVTLRGLAVDEVGTMLRTAAGTQPTAGMAAAVHRRTEGNPFFVSQLLRMDDPGRLLAGPVPTGVRDVVRRRVTGLPQALRALLDTSAIVGDDVEARLVAGMRGLIPETGLEAAECQGPIVPARWRT